MCTGYEPLLPISSNLKVQIQVSGKRHHKTELQSWVLLKKGTITREKFCHTITGPLISHGEKGKWRWWLQLTKWRHFFGNIQSIFSLYAIYAFSCMQIMLLFLTQKKSNTCSNGINDWQLCKFKKCKTVSTSKWADGRGLECSAEEIHFKVLLNTDNPFKQLTCF